MDLCIVSLRKSLKFDYGLGTQEELEIKQEEVARKEEAQRKENEQKKKEAQRIEADYAKHKKAVGLFEERRCGRTFNRRSKGRLG